MVGRAWLDACLAAGRFVPEAPFAVVGDDKGVGAPEKSRRRLAAGGAGLFAGLRVHVAPWSNARTTIQEAQQLLATGAARFNAVALPRDSVSLDFVWKENGAGEKHNRVWPLQERCCAFRRRLRMETLQRCADRAHR